MSGPSQVEPAEPLLPGQASDSLMFRTPRPRGFLQQATALLLQPGYFYRTLFVGGHLARGWLAAALVILVLVGIAAVPSQASTDTATPTGPGDLSGAPPGIFEGGGGPISPVGPPGDVGGGATVTGASPAAIADAWTTALLAGTGFIVSWIAVAALLVMAPLFSGQPANYARALQVAVWASLPFALMALLRLIFSAAGGEPGKMGISGLLDDWTGYRDLPVILQSLLLSLTEHLTLFWLWNLFLIGLGARLALGGRRWVAATIVVLWAILVVVTPVTLGITRPAEPEQPTTITVPDGPPGEVPDEPSEQTSGEGPRVPVQIQQGAPVRVPAP
jgi:hypothetical protein